MDKMKRYAVYYAPPAGPFATAAAQWLGWDPVAGVEVQRPDIGVDLNALTGEPRRYGFHGTIKPPFRLADGVDVTTLETALCELTQSLHPVEIEGLQLLTLEGFLALTPLGDCSALTDLAAQVVQKLDPLRAPLTEAEIVRRRPALLSRHQRALLDRFGYPYVMDEFRFHLTLSNNLNEDQVAALLPLAKAYFAAHLPRPFRLFDLCLFGEAEDGRFYLLHRYPLG